MIARAPSPQPPSPPLPAWGRLLLLIVWVLLTIYFLAPPRDVLTGELDSSNHGTYAWMLRTGQQFGADVIPMTGPWGFLVYGLTYSGDLLTQRLLGDLLLKGAIAFLVLSLARTSPSRLARASWIVLLVLFAPYVDDLLYDVSILVAALVLLSPNRAKLGVAGLVAAALIGFTGLLKGTHLMLAMAALGFVGLAGLQRREPRQAVIAALVAITAFLLGWLGSGQNPANLPGYLHGAFALASGYNQSMGLEETVLLLATGLTLAGGTAILLLATAVITRGREALPLLFIALFSFVKWKHGFLRADGHVHIFFTYAVLVAPLCWIVAGVRTPPTAPARPPRHLAFGLLGLALTVLAMAAASEFRGPRFLKILREAPARFSRNCAYLQAPSRFTAPLARQLEQNRIAADLPRIRNEVGTAPIDHFGFEQGVILLNNLNYHPRPMGGGSFNVFHPHLQHLNNDFIRDPLRRPEYFLTKLRTLDQRLPAMDDSPTLIALLHLYAPVCLERDQLLMRLRPGTPIAPVPVLLSSRTVRAGEPLEAPPVDGDSLVLFTLQARPTLAGRLRGTLYRPPPVEAVLSGPTLPAPRTFRLIPLMLQAPALLSPLLEDNSDLLQLFEGSAGTRIDRLELRTPGGGFRDEFTVTFYTLPRPPRAQNPDTAEIRTFHDHPLHNRPPVGRPPDTTGIRELNKEPILLVHAPGTATFQLQPGDLQLVFSYGLMPQAYAPGRTDGVEFTVEVEKADGTTVPLFQKLLQPVERPEDRGVQQARLFLPPDLDQARLHLRTGTGPLGNGAWDQSFLARIQIKSGEPDPRQYFGFNVTPEAPGFTGRDALLLAEGRPARLFHAPCETAFPIPSKALQVVLGFGLLPGAYTGGNRTDGVEFAIEIESPERVRTPLFTRLLDPLAQPADRGTQTVNLTLPHTPPGSRLWLRTSPGPQGDASWDWSYVQTLFFHR